MNQSTLNAIWEECKTQAGGSEFQVHYRAMVARLKNNDAEFSLVIPTAFYNFKQEVSSATVEWENTDALKGAEKCAETSMAKVNTIVEAMPLLSKLSALGEFEISESNAGTIHRHPGRFGFSSTDYDINPEEPGVVFRKTSATDFLQNDSVMYFSSHVKELVCSETRIVNVKPAQGGGIEGTYEEVETYSLMLQDEKKEKVNLITNILGSYEEENILNDYKHTSTATPSSIKKYPILMKILEEYKASGYSPSIIDVDGDLISQRTVVVSYGGGYYNQSYRYQASQSNKQVAHSRITIGNVVKEWNPLTGRYEEIPDTTPKETEVKKSTPSVSKRLYNGDYSDDDWDEYFNSHIEKRSDEDMIREYYQNLGLDEHGC